MQLDSTDVTAADRDVYKRQIICSNNDDMALAAARTAKDNPNYAKTIFLGFDGQKSAVEALSLIHISRL